MEQSIRKLGENVLWTNINLEMAPANLTEVKHASHSSLSHAHIVLLIIRVEIPTDKTLRQVLTLPCAFPHPVKNVK